MTWHNLDGILKGNGSLFRVGQKSRTVKTSFYMKKDTGAMHVDSGIRLNKDICSSYDWQLKTGDVELWSRRKTFVFRKYYGSWYYSYAYEDCPCIKQVFSDFKPYSNEGLNMVFLFSEFVSRHESVSLLCSLSVSFSLLTVSVNFVHTFILAFFMQYYHLLFSFVPVLWEQGWSLYSL